LLSSRASVGGLRDLHERFALESVTPLDMFPQTAEIEVAAHLRAVPPGILKMIDARAASSTIP